MAEKIDCKLKDAVAALQFLYCTDTDEWLRAGMALKDEFGDDALDDWLDWSAGDKRYKKKECENRWKGWKGSSGKGTVKIGYIFKIAFERGFRFDHPERTPEEKAAFAAECEKRREEREAARVIEEADLQRWYQVVANVAKELTAHLKPVGSSPYLGKKRVKAFGVLFAPHSFVIRTNENFTVDILSGGDAVSKFFKAKKENKTEESFLFFKKDSIAIPIVNMAGELKNLQIIFTDGEKKRFLTNGPKTGLFHIIGEIMPDVPILFCEGYATGASLYMATGWPVVVCFDAGNVPSVCEQFAHYANIKICAGDNDWETALDLKKKNTGVVKASEAAKLMGGTWCVPEFFLSVKDPKGLSDFNDLHVAAGLPVVKQQIQKALDEFIDPTLNDPAREEIPIVLYEDSLQRPSEFAIANSYEIGAMSDEDFARFSAEYVESISSNDSSPEPSLKVEQLSLENLLQRYALTEPDARVWDSQQQKLIKAGAFKNIVRPTLYKEWLEHKDRRTVALDDVQIQAAAAQKKGRGGLSEALRRYVYLNPSDTVWDKDTRELVAVSHLKIAIADWYGIWVTHPEREEIPLRNLVFDPTQKVSSATHINQFRGLALRPVRNDKRCERIVRMMMALCNNNREVFRWLRRWLAYPLINVGAKMETAVLCHSDVHGSGKSYFFDVVMRAIYGEYSRTVGQAQLEGQYNDWMSKVLYCVYEEVLSRSQRYSHTGTIKQTITGKTVRIEKKFMSGWEESNHMNSVFLSNEVLPLPVEPSDRRFLVIWPETKLYEELQRGVDEDLKNGGAAAFMQFLLETKMQEADEEYPFNEHTKPPMTEAKERLIEHGRSIWEVFYLEWERGSLEHCGVPVPHCCIRIGDLFKLFEGWCSKNKEHAMGAHKFSSFISSKLKKRRDLHYSFVSSKGKATFYIVGTCPDNKTQEEWLGACVHEFERIMSVNSLEDRHAA